MADFKEFLNSDLGKSLIAGGIDAGSSLWGSLAGSKRRKRKAEKGMKKAEKLYEAQLAKLRSGQYDITQEELDASSDQKVLAEQFEDLVRKRGEESRSDVISALQSGDPRTMQLASQEVARTEAQTEAGELKALGQKVAADKATSARYAEGQRNEARLEASLMDRAGMSAEMFRQELEGEKRALGQAGPSALQSFLQTGLATYGALKDEEVDSPYTGGDDEDEDDVKEGEHGMRTDGEFSHKRNPISMVAADGSKVGEVTGGELVFNPEQSGEMEDLINEGNAEGLLEYLRNLLSQPQFDK